ncbi:MAG: hypothetical protein M3M85_04185 [bacterium]|nr:hypothetical protein [bacterium]
MSSHEEPTGNRLITHKDKVNRTPRENLIYGSGVADFFAVAEDKESNAVGGAIFPESGFASVRQGDKLYTINIHAPDEEVVHELTDREIATLHMSNLHLDPSRRQLSIEEIGNYPFESLVKRLEVEYDLFVCLSLIDNVLDPLGEFDPRKEESNEVRLEAVELIEKFLRENPNRTQPLVDQLKRFIPPEGYRLDNLDEIIGSSNGEKRLFSESSPLLFKLISEVQPDWERNIVVHADKRLTRQQIQEHHDRITEIASQNFLNRAQKSSESFTQAIEALEATNTPEDRRKKKDFIIVLHRLPDAKGDLMYLRKRFVQEQERFTEAGSRRPRVLERFNQAQQLIVQAEELLPKLEELLGEPIKVSNILA